VNLPNALTIGRILIAPLVAALPFISSPFARLVGFVIYIAAAITDYYDGKVARTRNLVTDLGRLLDPLADKLLLFATLIPIFILMAPRSDPFALSSDSLDAAGSFPFKTPLGDAPLPWWIVAIVVGRELFMTAFRQIAARRGVVIAAIGPAKWKTGFQSVWVGSAYFWFFAATLAASRQWTSSAWRAFAYFNGLVGVVTMIAAVVLTLYSFWLYLDRYGRVVTGRG
jgi:CDP-diacylglycerol--glycerol-3-phosphate 3-phosphatidyltransferase